MGLQDCSPVKLLMRVAVTPCLMLHSQVLSEAWCGRVVVSVRQDALRGANSSRSQVSIGVRPGVTTIVSQVLAFYLGAILTI